ncbi:MAG: tryptophan--tRNA ligase [Candidatus Dojkabacteria bacterium]|nr:tryptophan--tRNA ligase [Candidatus Dojkabacteria bacterium]
MKNYKTSIFTGMRPTSGITIGNLIGAIKPTLDVLEKESSKRPMLFVADLHSLTTNEGKDTQGNVISVLKDYIAAGLDPEKADLFVQSQIADEISKMTIYLSRLVTVSELLRIPTLKEKIRSGQSEMTVNGLLALYPVMMASDILLQGSEYVPVGKDQYPHMEITCEIVRKFNKKYGDTLLEPKPLDQGEPVNILSLTGDGSKMSKTNPNGAIILSDDIDVSLKKVKRAKTAFAGEMNDDLDSLLQIAKYVSTEEEGREFDRLIEEHMEGKQVMGDFKNLLMSSLERFLKDFQSKKAEISDDYVLELVKKGGEKARSNAREVLEEVEKAMGMRFV